MVVSLATYVADIQSVITLVLAFIGQILDLACTHPVLVLFVALGVVSIGVRQAFRIMHKTKSLAN